ncbi:putative cobalamin binding protein [Thaumarchaeota archaeon SCGC AB-539-E09]|nr:putative cobalamin binding protein [Thaumarchaeota archaeon SCGC AB-539-E09]
MNEDIKSLLLNMADIDELKKTVNAELESGTDPLAIIKTLNEALYEVGERYEQGDLFLSELMMIGYLAREVTNILKPHMVREGRETRSKIVFGTVKGDIHDIGKNVVIMMLQSAGLEVIDLGVDVSSERFVESVKNNDPDVLCMSSLLTSTMNEMGKVIAALDKAGLRGDVQVVVGGRPITEKFAQEVGADGHANDAINAVRVIRELVEEG